MILLIAYMIMYHLGEFSAGAYIGTFLIWIAHIGFHYVDLDSVKAAITEKGK